MPIHIHSHDTAGASVATMVAAAKAGADIVDVAIDSMSGLTSQPSMGAVAAALKGTELETSLDLQQLSGLNAYWDSVRGMYLPFESGQLAGSSDVYAHEIPGGQYTNLLYQSKQLGLDERWAEIKKKYAQANLLLGDIPKVTPSSKVVGDLAQFMVSSNLEPEDIMASADSLPLPASVVSYFQGAIGVPPGGFPEPLTSKVRKGRSLPDGSAAYEGRPGATMPDYDFAEAKKELVEKYGEFAIDETEVLSHAMYPQVYTEFQAEKKVFGDLGILPTNLYLNPMKVGQEEELYSEAGRSFLIKMVSISQPDSAGMRDVALTVNGELWQFHILDLNVDASDTVREKASVEKGSVGAPMPGVVVETKVEVGDTVEEGQPLVVLSAMKMETVIPAPMSGKVERMTIVAGDKVDGDDLLVAIS